MSDQLALILSIAIGLLLDYIFGDPRKMPHLVKAIGQLSLKLERFFAFSIGRTICSGLCFWLALSTIIIGAYIILITVLSPFGQIFPIALNAILVFQAIAFTDLVKHVRDIRIALSQNIDKARFKTSMIVGRDTDRMQEDDVCRAAIESASENLSDSVVAPLFWLAVAGPIGLLLYRVSNTLDAMVGHRTDRYEKFGKVAARIDDVLNFIPARLCSLLILSKNNLASWTSLAPDAKKHPSINAGWPEAAMAHQLGVVIGGRMYEKGKLVQTAEMNATGRQPTPNDIEHCISIMGTTHLKIITLLALTQLAILWL